MFLGYSNTVLNNQSVCEAFYLETDKLEIGIYEKSFFFFFFFLTTLFIYAYLQSKFPVDIHHRWLVGKTPYVLI